MKVKVKDIKPNPFRDMEKYHIRRDKIELLKKSINETGFWDNIVVRKAGNKYELAYGHHRWKALQELDIKEVDIPVKDLDDFTMFKMMANENLEIWGVSTDVLISTVKSAKKFLDEELKKYDSWEDLNKSIKILFETEHSFIQTKKHGIGQTTIKKFLGDGWKQWQIQEALRILDDAEKGEIDIEAVEVFEEPHHARTFRKKVTDNTAKKVIKKEDQKDLARKIKKEMTRNKEKGREGTGYKFIEKEVEEEVKKRLWEESKKTKDIAKKEQIEKIKKEEAIDRIFRRLKNLKDSIHKINNDIAKIILLFKEEKVTGLSGIETLGLMKELSDFFTNVKLLRKYIGIKNIKYDKEKRK